MSSIAIVTDSSSDLPADEAARLKIAVVPLTIRFGSDEFVDRADLTAEEFWVRCKTAPALPETAAPSPGAFQEAFQAAKDAGADGVVCLTISSKLSATYQSALAAASSMAPFPVEVIDSLTVTLPLGLLTLVAAEAAAEGDTLDDVLAKTADAQRRLHVVFTIDTLEHLKKGGRIGGAKALLGSMLSIKPILTLQDGVVHEEGRQRTRAKSLDHLVVTATAGAPFERLAVVHGDASADAATVAGKLAGLDCASPVIMADIGPVVGTHAGPGVIGVCWITRS